MKTIGERIKNKRKELGMTQAELAQKLNVTDRAVSKWEVDEGNPDIGIIPNLCMVLGITTDYLLLGKEEKESISIDDMDDSKRFELVFKNDDIKNFNKYKYFDKKVFPNRSSFRNYNVAYPRCEVIERMIGEKKEKILNACFDEFTSKYKALYNDDVYVNELVSKIFTKFVKAAIDHDRDDVLKVLGVKFLDLIKIEKEGSISSQRRVTIYFGPNPTKKAEEFSKIVEYIFENAKTSPKCFKYIIDLPIEDETGKCLKNKYPIEQSVIKFSLKYKKYDVIDKLCDLYDAPIERLNKKEVEQMQFSNSFLTKHYHNWPEARLIAFDEETIHHLLANDQEKIATKLVEHNKKIYDLFPPFRKPNIYIMNDNDVKQYIRLNSDKYSEKERYEYSCVRNRIIVVEALEESRDLKFVRRILKENYLNYYEFAYDALLNNKKNELYKELVDIESSSAREVLRATNEENKKKLLKDLWLSEITNNKHSAISTGFERLNEQELKDDNIYHFVNEKGVSKIVKDILIEKRKPLIEVITMLKDNPIIEYFGTLKQKIYDNVAKKVEEDKVEKEEKLEREKIVKELNKSYFTKLLANDGEELFIIKLCSLFDAYLKFDYEIEGEDFSDRMNTYFKDLINKTDEEDEEELDYLEHLKDIFNRLRMLRNNIAHSENNKVKPLSIGELRECLDYTFSISKGGK